MSAQPEVRGPEAGVVIPPSATGPAWTPTFGAIPDERGTTFRVWASGARHVQLRLEAPDGTVIEQLPMVSGRDGLFEARSDAARAGTLYRYLVDHAGPYPDPASRFQPNGVHGASEVIDWSRFAWTDSRWSGVRFEDLVIYELHVGAFSPRGGFLDVLDRLPYLVDLGVTAIEIMPVAAFAGARNWGYDGAALYAAARQYGRPEDLQCLVDAAHAAGLAVLIDVVYNHLGPDGAYLAAFSPDFFSSRHQSPWGDGVNLDGPGSGMVRRFLLENALHWILEYHVDGLRLDATHALNDDSQRHFLAEIAGAAHGMDLGRPVHVIAEDERNLAALVRPESAGGMGLDGVWADDFHHHVHRLLTGEHEGYYVDYSGSIDDVKTTIEQGWFYTGQHSAYAGHAKGSDPRGVDRQRFIFCLQNHDQVGNRGLGERLHELADLPSYRAATALLLLAPETPLLFMGQEWAASTPFLYFTDHGTELGRLITEGRRREFERFSAFSAPDARNSIPDPQDERTFEASRLVWDEIASEPHASMLALHRALLALRGRDPDLADAREVRPPVARALDAQAICLTRNDPAGDLIVVARFGRPGRVTLPASTARPSAAPAVVLTTEDPLFAADSRPARVTTEEASVTIEFARPGAVIFRAVTP